MLINLWHMSNTVYVADKHLWQRRSLDGPESLLNEFLSPSLLCSLIDFKISTPKSFPFYLLESTLWHNRWYYIRQFLPIRTFFLNVYSILSDQMLCDVCASKLQLLDAMTPYNQRQITIHSHFWRHKQFKYSLQKIVGKEVQLISDDREFSFTDLQINRFIHSVLHFLMYFAKIIMRLSTFVFCWTIISKSGDNLMQIYAICVIVIHKKYNWTIDNRSMTRSLLENVEAICQFTWSNWA
jgi:hypothetical protein